MKSIITIIMVFCAVISTAAQAQAPSTQLQFTSNDSTLQSSFDWARNMALSYSHGQGDPVGPWCEAALPQREAFCIRDVCHQSVGAHLLGLTEQNKNMMKKFVDNIALSRDWCTFWELDRYDRPAPIDYESDKEFWYNLNANFDIIFTAWRLYNWSGDNDYVNAPEFTNFYNLSLDQYLDSWQLRPSHIMSRPRYMNRDSSITPENRFYHCRGIPSYVENFPGICVGIDLLASLYAGHMSAALISAHNSGMFPADTLIARANQYRDILESQWWDDSKAAYHTFFTENREFASGEGIPFALWFDFIPSGARHDASVNAILNREWNIENLSYFPTLLLDMGYPDEAYNLIGQLPSMNRSEYPEVSFAMIETIIRAAMGLKPDATDKSISTEYRLGNIEANMVARNVPLFDGFIDIAHNASESTTLTNNTSAPLKWTAIFNGESEGCVIVDPQKSITIHPHR